MTNEEKIAKIEEVLFGFAEWMNQHLHLHMNDGLMYQHLMVYLDNFYKEEADEIGRETIWRYCASCVSYEKKDAYSSEDLSAWID